MKTDNRAFLRCGIQGEEQYPYILAVKSGALSILSASLAPIGEIGSLKYPYAVTGVEAFPMDLDNDGNLGTFEDSDGDVITSQQETFDLALVSTNDGLVIFDVTNPGTPNKIALIPGAGGKIVVDRERRLAYTLGGSVISLNDLKPNDPTALSLIDANKDNKDDRVLNTIDGMGGMDFVFSDDGSMAYIVNLLI